MLINYKIRKYLYNIFFQIIYKKHKLNPRSKFKHENNFRQYITQSSNSIYNKYNINYNNSHKNNDNNNYCSIRQYSLPMYNIEGEKYERYSRSLLQEIGFNFRLTVKTKDGGLDLVGHIRDKDQKFVNCYGQCKNSKHRMSVNILRDFEGTLLRQNNNNDANGSDNKENNRKIGILISSSGFTSDLIYKMRSSYFPIVLIHIPVGGGIMRVVENGKARLLYPDIINLLNRH